MSTHSVEIVSDFVAGGYSADCSCGWSMPWPEYVAMRFHQAYEELAPLHGYETRRASAVPWVDVPEQNRDLMVDVVRRLLAEGVIRG